MKSVILALILIASMTAQARSECRNLFDHIELTKRDHDIIEELYMLRMQGLNGKGIVSMIANYEFKRKLNELSKRIPHHIIEDRLRKTIIKSSSKIKEEPVKNKDINRLLDAPKKIFDFKLKRFPEIHYISNDLKYILDRKAGDKKLYLVDATTGESIREFETSQPSYKSGFSPNSKYIYITDNTGLKIYDIGNSQPIKSISMSMPAEKIEISPNELYIAFEEFKSLRVFNMDGSSVREKYFEDLKSYTFTSDSKNILVMLPSKIEIYDLDLNLVKTIDISKFSFYTYSGTAQDRGEHIIISVMSKFFMVNLKNSEVQEVKDQVSEPFINPLAHSQDGKYFVYHNRVEGTLRILDKSHLLHVVRTVPNANVRLKFSEDNSRIMIINDQDYHFQLWKWE